MSLFLREQADIPPTLSPPVTGLYHLFEPLEEGVLLLDAVGCILYLNPAAASLLGIPRDTLIGSLLHSILPELFQTGGIDALRDAVLTDPLRRFTVHSSGRAILARAQRTTEGLCLYVRPSPPATTPLPSEPDQEFKALFELSAIGKVQADIETNRFLRVNRKFCEITGYTEEELLQKTVAEITYEEDRVSDRERFLTVLSGAQKYWYSEKRYIHKQGHLVWVQVNGTVIRNAQGAPLRSLADIIDITERKRTEESLKYRSEQFATLLHRAPLAVYLIDSDFRVMEANPVVLSSVGDLPGGVIGRDFDELSHLLWEKTFADRIVTLFRQTLETGVPYFAPEEASLDRTGAITGYFEWRIDRLTLPDGHYGLVCYVRNITAEVHARQTVETSEALFRTLGETVPLHLWMSDGEGRPLYQNPAWHAYTGIAIDQRAVNAWENLHHPEDLPALRRAWNQSVQHHTPLEVEARLRRHDGVYRWFACRTVPILDAQGQVVKWVGTHLDIDAQKQVEQSLRDSEARLRAFYNASPLCMGVTEPQEDDVLHLYDNPATCRFFGTEPGSTVGKRAIADLKGDPATIAIWLEHYRCSEATGESTHFEHELPGVNGPRWLSVIVSPLTKSDPAQRTRFCYVAEDITERKLAEAALAETARTLARERERLAVALRTGQMGVYEWRVGDSLVWWSPEIYPVYGVDPATFTPTMEAFNALVHPDDREELWRKTESSLKQGDVFIHEYRILRPEGTVRWIANRSVVGVNADGLPERITGVAADITTQKQVHQEIADLNIQLKRAIAETHHRVKNNLQTLSALMEIHLPDSEETVPAAALQRIWQHTRTLAALHDVLTIDARGMTPSLQGAVSLKAALEKLVPLLQSLAGNRTLRVEAEDILVSLKQGGSFVLLVNELVSNALKHGSGDITVAVSRTTATDGTATGARLTVCDDGPGFPPDFDPAFAANTGLELVESLGGWDLNGQTRYTNREQGGACVMVTFPLPSVSQ